MLCEVGENPMIVPTTGSFRGIVRINKTARFILECMQEDITKEAVIEKMAEKYDAPRAELEESVDLVLETLRKIGALDE